MKAVILAGGKGTRLRPLTCNLPKPMVPLLDRPLMEYAIELLKRHGITDIAVTMHYLPEVIRKHFGDGSEYGVRLHYFEEDAPLGTAGSVKGAESFLTDTFLVLSGDALTDFDLSAALSFHKRRRAIGTLVLARVEVPLDFGVVMTDRDGRIRRFVEKPGWGEVFSDTVNTGIYILEPEVLQYCGQDTECDFSKELFPLLLMLERPLYGYRAEGYWSDIGNLVQYRQAQYDILAGKVKVRLQAAEELPGVWIGEGVYRGRGVEVQAPAYIGHEAVLEDGVEIGPYTVVGSGSLLLQGVSVERSVLWSQSVLEPYAEVKGAVLGRQSFVGSGAVLEDGAVLGDGSRVGVKGLIQTGTKIWPGKILDRHCQLKQSLVYGDPPGRSLFGRWGVRGSCHGELTIGFAIRLAQALGSLLPIGAAVGVGHDGSPYAAVLAEVMAAGLHASGVHTHDFGPATSAVTRHAVSRGEYAAGVQVREWFGEADMYVVELLDARGLLLEGNMARKVEAAYQQEECRRIRPRDSGSQTAVPDVNRLYRDHLLQLLDRQAVARTGFQLVVQCDGPSYRSIVPEVLEAIGCRVLQGSARSESRALLSDFVRMTHSDLGVSLNGSGRLERLVDEKGEPVRKELLSVLQVLLQLEEGVETLHVPVHLPGIVERLGEAYNRVIIRTKTDVRSDMLGCEREGFHLRYDGVYMLTRLLEMLARGTCTLSELVSRLPDFALSKRKVECPWQDKGRVMRYLMEETRHSRVELIDGIKVFHEEGWTLILPDNDEPVVRVVAHAGSPQQADSLALAYARMIEEFRGRFTAS